MRNMKGVPKRLILNVALVAALALGLGGCMRSIAEYTIHDDDTVDAVVIMAFDRAEIDAMISDFGMSTDELLEQMEAEGAVDEMAEGLGDNFSMDDYDEDGFVGWKFTSTKPLTLSDLNTQNTGAGESNIQVIHEGGQFKMTGEIDATDLDSMFEDLGDLPAEQQAEFEEAMESVEIEMRFTFPGPIESSTGTISGNTVTFTPKIGEITSMEVIAADGGTVPPPPTDDPKPSESASPTPTKNADNDDDDKDSGFPLWAILAIAGGALVIAAVVVTIVVVSSKKKKAAAAAASAGQGYGGLPGASGFAEGGWGATPPQTEQWPAPEAPAQQWPAPAPEAPTQQWPEAQPPAAPPAQPPADAAPTQQWGAPPPAAPAAPEAWPGQQPQQPPQPPQQWPGQPPQQPPQPPQQQWPPQQ